MLVFFVVLGAIICLITIVGTVLGAFIPKE